MADNRALRTSGSLLDRLRLRPDDPEAWAEFVHRYGPRIYQWCLDWRLQSADAQDVTQNVLLKLVAKMRDFEYDQSQSFRAWLKTVTGHALSDYLDARRRQGTVGDGEVATRLENLEARQGLERRLEEEFDAELLEEALGRVRLRVTPQRWEAFRLTALEGFSGAEAARQLGMPVATVYTAKSKIQQMIAEEVRRLEEPERPPRG